MQGASLYVTFYFNKNPQNPAFNILIPY